MSIYSDYKSGAMSDDEYKFECGRENRKDKTFFERLMEEDACYERCQGCEMYDAETLECAAGENMLRCTIC